MTEQTICMTIDGQEVYCPPGCTIYEAATAAGFHIPTFCHHEKLTPVGACRMCLVEIEGARGLQTSCTTPVREGMVVKIHTSPAAVKARRANIEFLLTNHPLDCPVCDKGGECPLQNQAMLDGPGQSRYAEDKRHKNKRAPLGELIVLDQERCVLCWRCIRFLDEWAADHELDLFGRSAATRLDTFPGRPLQSKWQGNTIDLCPVGALTSRIFRFEARVWELENTESVCPLCSVGCKVVLGVKNNELCRITPHPNPQVNDAWLCDRGRFSHGYVDSPRRLKSPLIRHDGTLEPATWDEALALVATRLSQIVDQQGPQAVAGLASTRVTNEADYLFQRFFRSVVGTNSVDHLGRLPAGATPLGALPDLEQRDLFLLLDFDPSTEAPLVELWIKKAVLRHEAHVIVAHPRCIELARLGGPWLGCRPGGETALLNGLARAALEAGLSSTVARVANAEEFRAWLRQDDPQRSQQLTGASAAAVQEAGRLLAGAKRPVILYGPDWLGSVGQAGSLPYDGRLAALANLALLLGGIEAAFVPADNNTLGALEMGAVPDLLPGGQSAADSKVRSRLAGFWGGKLSPLEGLDFEGMLAAAQEGELGALWVMGADPASDCRAAGEALGRVPFLVVQDLFLTDTAELAEVVLPAASFAETDGTYTNLTGRLQALRTAKRPPGAARPDWWIVAELAKRMVDAKRQRAWSFGGAAEILDEIARVIPAYRGLSLAAIGEAGWQPPALPPAARRAFVQIPAVMAGGGEPAPTHTAEATSAGGEIASSLSHLAATANADGYPLRLVTGHLLYDRGTLLGHCERTAALVPAPYLLVHPTDAAVLGVQDGDEVSVVSDSGRLEFAARISDEVVPGVVFAPLNLTAAPVSVLFAERGRWPWVRIVK